MDGPLLLNVTTALGELWPPANKGLNKFFKQSGFSICVLDAREMQGLLANESNTESIDVTVQHTYEVGVNVNIQYMSSNEPSWRLYSTNGRVVICSRHSRISPRFQHGPWCARSGVHAPLGVVQFHREQLVGCWPFFTQTWKFKPAGVRYPVHCSWQF